MNNEDQNNIEKLIKQQFPEKKWICHFGVFHEVGCPHQATDNGNAKAANPRTDCNDRKCGRCEYCIDRRVTFAGTPAGDYPIPTPTGEEEWIIEKTERIVILYGNFSGRENDNRSLFRDEVRKIVVECYQAGCRDSCSHVD